MASIIIVGGTGFTGSNIAREAVRRGDSVTSVSRHAPETPIEGVRYLTGEDAVAVTRDAIDGTDTIVATLSPRGATAGHLGEIYGKLGEIAADAGARLIVVGGFGSLRPAAGQPRLAEGDALPEFLRPEAREVAHVADDLASAPEALDWVFISPAESYGSHLPEQPAPTGTYRVGGDVAEFGSIIGGDDFALAVVDEVEKPAHHREHISLVA